MKDIFLPGHPENTPSNIPVIIRLQYATWMSFLTETPGCEVATIETLAGITLRQFTTQNGDYIVRAVNDIKKPYSSFTIERYSGPARQAKLTYRINSRTGLPFEDLPLTVDHAQLGMHGATTGAVAIGRLEQIMFQQGPAAFRRNLGYLIR